MSDAVRDAMAASLLTLTAQVTPAVASGYGVDLVCFDDLTPNLDETDPTTTQSLAQDNYHRLTTQAGSLPDDTTYGTDVLDLLSIGTTPTALLAIQGAIETELKKDDRNQEVSATVTFTLLPTVLTISVQCTPADSDLAAFTLIINVDVNGSFLKAIL